MGIEALAHAALRPLLFLGWIGFCGAFFWRRRGPRSRSAHRDTAGWAGFWVQAAGITIAWNVARPVAEPLFAGLSWTASALIVLALVLVGDGLMWSAVRTLGKQWALAARTRQDHELITGGPYARVRHPIYAALLAMLLATGVALSDPRALALGLLVYLFGTWLRIRAEERVLRASFGVAYDDYARRVPALLPRLIARDRP